MVLTNSAPVKFSAIQSEFGGSGAIKMSQYYTGAGNIIYQSGMTLIPSQGSSISVSQLRGRWKNSQPVRYPPAALTNNTTTLSGFAYGNGTYVCSTSYMYDQAANQPFKVFNLDEGGWYTGWSCVGRYDSSTGAYTGSTSTYATNTVTYYGEYFQFQFPVSVKLSKWSFIPRNDWSPTGAQGRLPNTYYILGSNNGSTWDYVAGQNGQTYRDGSLIVVDMYDNVQPYSYWRVIINVVGNPGESNRDGADIAEFRCWWS
jgi:hypothetical protein